jgi:Flp pilus assembly protein TadD
MTSRPRALREPWRLELRRGLQRLRAGEFADAAHHFARAHRLAPGQPEVCLALGTERLRAGDPATAEPLLRAAHDGAPDLISASATLARCLALYLDRPDEAGSVLDQALSRHGQVSALLVVQAELGLEAGDLNRAREAAEAALEACAREEAGGAVRTSARSAAAAALARTYNLEGLQRAGGGGHCEALFAFKRAADVDPTWSSPLVNVAVSLLALGRARAALAPLERALDREPDNPLAHLNHGIALHRLGRLAAARVALEQALHLDPHLDAAIVALAEVLSETGDLTGAEALVGALLGDRSATESSEP